MDRMRLLLSVFFGMGFAPIAPGTAGSAAACLICYPLIQTPSGRCVLAVLVVLSIVFSPGLAVWAEAHFGKEDPGQFVLDEVAACFLAAIFLPFSHPLPGVICVFLWFRLFDIWKPWPIRNLEKVPHGWGVLLDDLLAGVYTIPMCWATLWALGMLHTS